MQWLRLEAAVLAVDETGLLKQGPQLVGVVPLIVIGVGLMVEISP